MTGTPHLRVSLAAAIAAAASTTPTFAQEIEAQEPALQVAEDEDVAAPPPPPPPYPYSYVGQPYPRDLTAIGLSFHAGASVASVDEYELDTAIGFDEPAPLVDKHLRLDGFGSLLGGSMRVLLQGDDGVRGGMGVGLYALEDVELLHDPLNPAVTILLDGLWDANFELYFGKAFDAGAVMPYVEVKGSLHIVSATVELSAQPFGHVGTTQYTVPSFTVAPRAGLFIPLGEWLFLDVAGHLGLFGMERGGATAGLGLWSDL